MHSTQGIAMNLKRSACDRCHGQKLRCPRNPGDEGFGKPCIRCQRAGAICTVSAVQKTGRPRKNTRTPSVNSTKSRNNSIISALNDSRSPSVSRADTPSESVQSTATLDVHTARNIFNGQKFDVSPTASSESSVQPSDNLSYNPTLDSFFQNFDHSLMETPLTMDDSEPFPVGLGLMPDFDMMKEPSTFSSSSSGPHTPPSDIFSFGEPTWSKDFQSGTTKDMPLDNSPMIWDEVHEGMDEHNDLVSAMSNSQLAFPTSNDLACPKPPTAVMKPSIEMPHRREMGEQMHRRKSSGVYSDRTQRTGASTPDPESDANTQALLQIQLEIHSHSTELLASTTQLNSQGSQSKSLGQMLSTAEKFISLISELRNPRSSRNPSPQPEQSMLFPPAQFQQSALLNTPKPSQSPFVESGTDHATFYIVLACYLRLITAYETIVDIIGSQLQDVNEAHLFNNSITAGLQIGDFSIQRGTALESRIYLQIILHQLDLLSEAGTGFMARAQPQAAAEHASQLQTSQLKARVRNLLDGQPMF